MSRRQLSRRSLVAGLGASAVGTTLLGGAATATDDSTRSPDEVTERWSLDIGPEQATPVYADGRVFVGGGSGNVLGVDATTGEATWNVAAGGDAPVSMHYADGSLFVSSSSNLLYALDPSDGSVRWQRGMGGQVTGWTDADGTVYCTLDSDEVDAIDADEGTFEWSRSLRTYASDPTMTDAHLVYFDDKTARGLDPATGETVWKNKVYSIDGSYGNGNGEANGIVVDDSNLYVDGRYESVALDHSTGNVAWRRDIDGNRVPALGDGLVYFTDHEKTYALDAVSGQTQWTTSVGTAFSACDGENLYAVGSTGDDAGAFQSVDAETGLLNWQVEIPFETWETDIGGPVVGDDLVFVANSRTETVAAYGPPVETTTTSVTPGTSTATERERTSTGAPADDPTGTTEPPADDPTGTTEPPEATTAGESTDSTVQGTTVTEDPETIPGEDDEDEDEADDDEETSSDSIPGFGPLAALGGLGIGAWRLATRERDD
jgi:outer membrane protein assembly factor BamB